MSSSPATPPGSPPDTSRWLALAWFAHRRFDSLTDALGLRRFVLFSPRRKPWRDLLLMWRTFWLFVRERPTVVLVQNPSAVGTLWVTLLRPFFGYRIVVDAHNDAIMPYVHSSRFVHAVTYWLLKVTDLTLVTNEALARRVEGHGGRAFVLYDHFPHVPDTPPAALGPGRHVMFIGTYAPDEPLDELFAAAATLLDLPVTFHVTGKLKPARLAAVRVPPANVVLTGFLAEDDYWSLLRASDLVVDLSTMPHCLVCGAYEALAAAKPLLLSDEPSGRELFGSGAQYTANTAPALASALRRLLSHPEELAGQSTAARQQEALLRQDWDLRARALLARIAGGR